MQTLLAHLLKIQSEVETAKRPTRDYLIVIGTVVSTFLQRTSRSARGDSSLRHVRNGLTIANSIELVMSATNLSLDEERDVRELLNTINARINDLTHGSAGHQTSSQNGLRTGAGARAEGRGGRVFLDRETVLLKWMNCSIVAAAMPILRSSEHEAYTQEPLGEV